MESKIDDFVCSYTEKSFKKQTEDQASILQMSQMSPIVDQIFERYEEA